MVVLRSKKNVSKTRSRSRSRANIRSRTKTNVKSKSRSRTRKFMRGGANAVPKFSINTGGVSVKNLKSGFESSPSSNSGPQKFNKMSSFDPSKVKTSNPADVLAGVGKKFSSAMPQSNQQQKLLSPEELKAKAFSKKAKREGQHPILENPELFIESSKAARDRAKVSAFTTTTGAPATLGVIKEYNPVLNTKLVGWTKGLNPMGKVTGVSNTEMFGRARIVNTPEPQINLPPTTMSKQPLSQVQPLRVSSSGPNVGRQELSQAKIVPNQEPSSVSEAQKIAQEIQQIATPVILGSAETVPESTVSSVKPSINLMSANKSTLPFTSETGRASPGLNVGSQSRQASSEPSFVSEAQEIAQEIQRIATPTTLRSTVTVPTTTVSSVEPISMMRASKNPPVTGKTGIASPEQNIVSQAQNVTSLRSVEPIINVSSVPQQSITSTKPAASLTSTGITNVKNFSNIAQNVSEQNISNPILASKKANNKRPGVYFPQQGESVIDATGGVPNPLYAVSAAGTGDSSGYVTIEPSGINVKATRRVSKGKRKPSSGAVKKGENIHVTDPNFGYLTISPSKTGATGGVDNPLYAVPVSGTGDNSGATGVTAVSGASGAKGFNNPTYLPSSFTNPGYVVIPPVKGVENPGYISTTPLENSVKRSLYNSPMTVNTNDQGYQNLGSGYVNIDPNTGNVYKIKDPNIMPSTSQELTEKTQNKRNYSNEDLYGEPQIYKGPAPPAEVEINNTRIPASETSIKSDARFSGNNTGAPNKYATWGYENLKDKYQVNDEYLYVLPNNSPDNSPDNPADKEKSFTPSVSNSRTNKNAVEMNKAIRNSIADTSKIKTTDYKRENIMGINKTPNQVKEKEQTAKKEAQKRLAGLSNKQTAKLSIAQQEKIKAAKVEFQRRAEAAESNALVRQRLDKEANSANKRARNNAAARQKAANNEYQAKLEAEAKFLSREKKPINPALTQELARKEKELKEMQNRRATEAQKAKKLANSLNRLIASTSGNETIGRLTNKKMSELTNANSMMMKELEVNATLKRTTEEAVKKARAANAKARAANEKARATNSNVAARMAILERQKEELEALQAEVKKAKAEQSK